MSHVLNTLKTKTILYAEDEKVLQKSMQETLSFFFKKVFLASNGQEALEIYKEERIDIAILDIEMPLLSGIDVAKEIRKKDAELIIIFLSAYSSQSYLFDAIKIKVEDYLVKPFKLENLIDVFKKLYKNAEKTEKVHKLKDETLFFEEQGIIERANESIKLGEKEKELLKLLLEHHPNVLTKQVIDKEIWHYEMTETSYRSLVRNLRHKVSKELIQTVAGVGLKLSM